MTVAPNQFLLYDTAINKFVIDNFSGCIPNKTFSLLTGTPDRAFAEFVTVTTTSPRDGKPPLPRVAITIEDPELDPERFNPNVMRLLGFQDSTQYRIRQANYPVAIRLPYTLNFWTEKYREMNQYVQQLLLAFKFQYLNIRVDLDSISPVPVYGEKIIELYADGAVVNTGDLEPGQTERIYRRTFQMHLNAWIWDFNFVNVPSLKEFQLEFFDTNRDPNHLLEVYNSPQRETIVADVGAGA